MFRRIGALILLSVAAWGLPLSPVSGAQLVSCEGIPATIVGTDEADLIIGTSKRDVIVGLRGNDVIRGMDGDDLICGGQGRDRLFGGYGNDQLFGGTQNDILKGDHGKDQLFGNRGNDRLFGGPARDYLHGGSGVRDILRGKGGYDVCEDRQGTTIIETCEDTTPTNPPPTPEPPPDPTPPPGPVDFHNQTFEHSTRYTAWTAQMTGLVEIPLSDSASVAGRCYALLGLLRPDRTDGVVANTYTTPTFGLIANGQYIDSGYDCDWSLVRSAGYRSLYGVEVTEGTVAPFFDAFFVPATNGARPSQVVVGSTFDPDPLVYLASLDPVLPDAPRLSEGPRGALPPALAGAAFMYQYSTTTSWSGGLTAVVEVPLGTFTDEVGQCYVILGRLRPDSMEGLVSSPYRAPDYGLIAGGELIDSGYGCDTSSVEDAGYTARYGAVVTEGTSIAIYEEFFVPASNGSVPDRLVVGSPTESDSLVYSVTINPVTPSAPLVDEGQRPGGLQPVAGSGFSYKYSNSESWDGELHALVPVPTDQFWSSDGTCYLLVGTLTPTAVEGVVSNAFHAPDLGLIAEGRYMGSGYQCETDAAEAAGYGGLYDAEVTVGTDYYFFAEFFLPEGMSPPDRVVVGDASSADHLVYAAVTTGLIPVIP